MVDYGASPKCYRIYNSETKRVRTCQDVKIPEIPKRNNANHISARYLFETNESKTSDQSKEKMTGKRGQERPKGSRNKSKSMVDDQKEIRRSQRNRSNAENRRQKMTPDRHEQEDI